ncbi:MAG: L,D-transpeptidase family protein [Syntrophus sp. (in: bacteria)]|nr:L,D-transpeptidase family protein [Syntrophus sp. (in: bacteria)]
MRFKKAPLIQLLILIGLILTWSITTGAQDAVSLPDTVSDHLLQRIANAKGRSLLNFDYNDEDTARLMTTLYLERKGRPAWVGEEGSAAPAEKLLHLLKRSHREGLYPQDYGIGRIESLMETISRDKEQDQPLNPDLLVDLDLLLTEAFFSYAAHYSGGRINHQKHYPGWVYKPRQTDLIKTLTKALESGNLEGTLRELAPRFHYYQKLHDILNSYIDIAENGGWPTIPAGRILKKGMRDKRVPLLKTRLMTVSEKPDSLKETPGDLFDRSLEAAVVQFQKQYGLKQDGTVGPSTLRELNIPLEVRICQVAVNLDRLRWLPSELGDRHLLINIPAFNLEVVEGGSVVMNIRAIVGKTDKRTNLLSSRITSIELNPYWRVPRSIAVEEYLPKLKKNPGYLSGKNMKVFTGGYYQNQPISPETVKWSRYSKDHFPYFLRQEPGAGNPLGRVKFVFSNEADIYIHDTSTRNLFSRNRRSFSHGCIRIEKPVDLASYLLKDSPNNPWSVRNIRAEIGKGKNKTLMLPKAVPVHIVYKTVWIDREGNLNFRPDLYNIDNIPGNLKLIRASLERFQNQNQQFRPDAEASSSIL